ncbi:unnamed protein product [Rotaria sp. Silwood1]|nr:unnamed protein product [Rotaria sp. Silwood1]
METQQEKKNTINEQQINNDIINGWGSNNDKEMEYWHKNFGTGYYLIKEENLSEASVYIDKQQNLKLYIKYINENALNELYCTKGYQTIGKCLVIDMKNNKTIGKYIISYGPCSDSSVFYEVSVEKRVIDSDPDIELATSADLANAIGIDLNTKFERQ